MATQYHIYIKGTGSSSYVYVSVDGTKYSSASTLIKNEGTEISVIAQKSITLNGKTVGTSNAMGLYYYTFPLVADTTITLNSSTSIRSAEIVYTEPAAPAPEPEHTTNIGAAAFRIESGTVRFGGAAYDIESGMVRVNGVAMEISLAKKMYTASLNLGSAVVTINGTEYTGSGSGGTFTLELPEGTVLSITTRAGSSAAIKLNNVTVATGNASAGAKYDYVLKANVAMVQRIGGTIIEITES